MGEGMNQVLNCSCAQNSIHHTQNDIDYSLYPLLNCRSMQKLP